MQKLLSALIFFTLSACQAGATPEPEAPDTEAAEESSEADEATAGEESSETADEEGSSDEEADSDDGGSKDGSSGGSAQRLLMQEGAAFIHSFKKSAEGEKAEERCEKASGGDAAKKAKCVAKATPKTTSGIRFVKAEGLWWFVRFEVKNKKSVEYNRIQAEFGEDTGSKVTVKTTGPDKGKGGKGAVPASFEIEVPDDYTVIIEEPGRGKTVYETKLGLFDEN